MTSVFEKRVLVVGKDNVMKWGETADKFLPVRDKSLFVYNKSGAVSACVRLFGKNARNAYAAHLLKKRIRSFKPDIVLFVGGFILPAELFEAAGDLPNVVKAAWVGDSWIWKEKAEISRKIKSLDALFLTATDFFDDAKQCGFAGKTFYAPLCANEELFKKSDLPRDLPPFFVGVANEDRHRLFEACETRCLIYGKGWDAGRLKQHEVHNEILSLEKAQRFVCRSVAPVNINITPNSRNNVNFRTFEISACGGLVISNPRADLALNYDIGAEAVVYEDPQAFNALIKDIAAHPAKYEEIARRGYERTMAQHTYAKRLEKMLKELTEGEA